MSLDEVLTTAMFNYLSPLCADAGIPDVIFDYGNGVELPGDFAAVDIKAINADSRPEVVYALKTGVINNELVHYRGAVLFALDIYSTTQALFKASQIKAGMWREKAHEEARKQNLGLVGYGDTLNLSALQDGRYRHRAQFDITLNFAFTYGIEDTTIGVAGVKGSLDGKYFIEEIITE